MLNYQRVNVEFQKNMLNSAVAFSQKKFNTCQFCCEQIHHIGRLCIPHVGLSNPYLSLIESPFLLVKPLMFLASAPVSVEARPIFIGQTMSNGQFSPNPLPAV